MKIYLLEKKGQYQILGKKGLPIKIVNDFFRMLKIRELSSHTIRAYGYDLISFYRWSTKAKRKIEELTERDLLDFIETQKQRNLSPSSINRQLTTIRIFYRFNTGKEMQSGCRVVGPSPYYRGRGKDRYLGLHKLKTPSILKLRVKTTKKLVQPLSDEQVLLLLRSFTRFRDTALFQLLLFCGLRSQELLNIKLTDICFKQKSLRVFGKGAKERLLPVPDHVIITIQSYLTFERPDKCNTEILFVILQGKRKGSPMTRTGLRSLFRHRRKKTELTNANPHRLRHTFGANMASQKVRLPVLQKIMGHSDMKMTLKYINLSIADLAEEFKDINKQIHKRYTKQ